MQLIFGLANRCKSYGILSSRSKPSTLTLSEIISLGITRFDGAEYYGWHPLDIAEFKLRADLSIATKVNVFAYTPFSFERDIIRFVSKFGCKNSILIYMHNPVTTQSLRQYQWLVSSIVPIDRVGFGISIYSEADLLLIREMLDICYRPSVIQLPLNLSTSYSQAAFDSIDSRLYARSIFSQGIYFASDISFLPKAARFALHLQLQTISHLAHELSLPLDTVIFLACLIRARLLGVECLVLGASTRLRLVNYIRMLNFQDIDNSLYELVESSSILYNEVLSDPRTWKT